MKKKKLILTILMISSVISIMGCSNAHSGRTDASGGHKDNKNVSGLGPYHYHCGGYPAHLHSNGVCPYKSGGTTSGSTKSTSSQSASSSSKSSSSQSTSSTSKSSTSTTNQRTTSAQATKTSSTTQVASSTVEVENISIKNTEKEVNIGNNLKLEATIVPENATNKSIIWSSSDESIAKVDEQGNVTPIKVGTVTITAKSNNQKTSSIDIKINQLPENIKIKNATEEIEAGSTIKLETSLTPEQATSNLTWTSSNNKVAIISSLGKLTALKEGEVVITVKTENGVSDSVTIKVKNKQTADVENNTSEEGGVATAVLALGCISGAAYLGYKKLFK